MSKTKESNELKGFKLLNDKSYKRIKNGDFIKYFVDTEFKHGGFVKHVGYPDYIVLINYSRKFSWSVQLKNPDLRLWIKPKEVFQEERTKKRNREKA
jgi:hypothetical protein